MAPHGGQLPRHEPVEGEDQAKQREILRHLEPSEETTPRPAMDRLRIDRHPASAARATLRRVARWYRDILDGRARARRLREQRHEVVDLLRHVRADR